MQRRRPVFLLIILLLTTVACGPLFVPEETGPTPELDANRVTLTVTPTPISTATILPTATANPGVPVPFAGIQMFGSLDGWAWGWDVRDGNEYLWLTTDGGLTWVEVTPQTMNPSHAGRGEFQNTLDAWIGVCGLPDQDCGLARTSDGGKAWVVVNHAILNIFDYDIRFFNERDGIMESYGAGAGKGSWMLRETHDGGATWTPVRVASYPDGLTPDIVGILETCNICGDILYIDPDRLIIVRGNLAWAPTEDVELSITTDRGRSWHNLNLPLPPNPFRQSWIHPLLPVFSSSHDGVLPVVLSEESHSHSAIAFYVTDDGGLSWTLRSLLKGVNNVEVNYDQLEFVSGHDMFVRCGDDLCVTHDSARTWQRLPFNMAFQYSNTEARVRFFDFGDAMTGWALVGLGEGVTTLWRTTDGGKTWMAFSPVFSP